MEVEVERCSFRLRGCSLRLRGFRLKGWTYSI